MTIFSKFDKLKERYRELRLFGYDPFQVRFDRVLSATEAILGERHTILLGTNNYLGLTFDPHCIEAAAQAATSHGTGTTGSRIANGTYADHLGLEQNLARFLGRRAAMIFTTGYQANLGMLSALVDGDDFLLLDADSHASIYDGARLSAAQVIRFRHSDPDDLARRLRRLEGRPGSRLIVVEGLYSMLGDTAPLAEIAAVKREYGAYLMVDEAHALGVYGERGHGVAEAAGIEADVDFVVGTFSKSLGAIGGFCASDLDEFDTLRVASRPYMFTASLPPSIVASVDAALSVIEARPELRTRLRANAQSFYGALKDMGFTLGPEASPIIAVQLPDIDIAMAFWSGLLEAGLYVNLALPPATPNHKPLLRCSVSAAHSRAQIDAAVAAFVQVGRALGVIPAERPVPVTTVTS